MLLAPQKIRGPWTAASAVASDPPRRWRCSERPNRCPASSLREAGSHTSEHLHMQVKIRDVSFRISCNFTCHAVILYNIWTHIKSIWMLWIHMNSSRITWEQIKSSKPRLWTCLNAGGHPWCPPFLSACGQELPVENIKHYQAIGQWWLRMGGPGITCFCKYMELRNVVMNTKPIRIEATPAIIRKMEPNMKPLILAKRTKAWSFSGLSLERSGKKLAPNFHSWIQDHLVSCMVISPEINPPFPPRSPKLRRYGRLPGFKARMEVNSMPQ